MNHFACRWLLAGTVACLGLAAAHAQNYPGRSVRMVVPFPPGSASDFLATLITQVNADAVKYLRRDDVRQRYQQNGADPMPTTPAEFEKVQRAEFVRVKRVIQDIDLKPQF